MQQSNPYQAPRADFNTGMDVPDLDQTPVYSPAGRFGRLSYLAWTGVVSLVSGVLLAILAPSLLLVLDPADTNAGAASVGMLLLLMLPFLVFGTIFAIRRLHDINMSGWWCLALIVPLVNIVIGLMLLFVPGTAGENNFGPPRETAAWEKIVAWIYIALMVLSTVGQIMLLGALVSGQ